MEAIILAGGFGTRLQHIISDVPKPMAPVANKPFLEFILEDLSQKGFNKFIMAVGYKSAKIIEYFGSHYKNLELEYSNEEDPLGTGGAIKKALGKCSSSDVFVINGDTFFDCDYKKLLEKHQSSHADITIAVKPLENYDRYGTVIINDDSQVIQFKEKELTKKGLINAGIYVLKKDLLKDKESNQFSFEKDILESMNYKISAEINTGYFIDIGIPSDYEKAQKDFK